MRPAELLNVLAAIQDREIRFTVSRGELFVKTIRGELSDHERAILKEHKTLLIEMIENNELKRTDTFQCERQVFDFAEKYFGGRNEKPEWGARRAS